MTESLYNLLSSKNSFVAWYPFCEDIHTDGFTPNVANQSDGSTLRLTLTSFGVGEYVGSGIANFVDFQTGFLKSTGSSLRISGDITIIYQCVLAHANTSETEIVLLQYAPGETESTNVLYEIRRNRLTGLLTYNHEYDNGKNVTVNASSFFPEDGNDHFFALTRDTATKNYNTYIDDSGVVSVSYSNNPSGGTSTDFYFPASGLVQSNGSYRNVYIFNEVLTQQEIDIIRTAGNPDASWFDYSNWNGSTGYVTWVYPSNTNKFYGIAINQRLSPYKAATSDKMQIKYYLYSDDKKRLSYIKNAPVELKLNISGIFGIVASGTTDSYGTYTFYYPCSEISGINNCLGYITTTINDEVYKSNVVRFNFA